MWINIEELEVVRTYLFGEVKFLDILGLLMICDIITGIFKAWKNKKLRSRNAYFGYIRKVLVFIVIIVANVIDNILGLGGALTYATVLFYVVNEGLSILENLSEVGVKVPSAIKDKLQVIQEKEEEK